MPAASTTLFYRGAMYSFPLCQGRGAFCKAEGACRKASGPAGTLPRFAQAACNSESVRVDTNRESARCNTQSLTMISIVAVVAYFEYDFCLTQERRSFRCFSAASFAPVVRARRCLRASSTFSKAGKVTLPRIPASSQHAQMFYLNAAQRGGMLQAAALNSSHTLSRVYVSDFCNYGLVFPYTMQRHRAEWACDARPCSACTSPRPIAA
eukprot:6198614-Pleurochrysis_carterae.AAC.4